MALIIGGDFDGSCSLIPLESVEGQYLLNESDHTTLSHHYCKQDNRTYCALRSIAICLNGTLEAAPKGQQFVRKDSHLLHLSKVKAEAGTIGEYDVLAVGGKGATLDMEDLKVNGMTLPTLGKLCETLGLDTVVYYATETSLSSGASVRSVQTLDEFRSTVLESLQKEGHAVVVNYLMSALGYASLTGHFSPIGGYHKKQDRFLVLDVWPDTHPVWVKSGDLFDAMKGVDTCSGLPRGFCILSPPTGV